jgi:hypothetical protein
MPIPGSVDVESEASSGATWRPCTIPTSLSSLPDNQHSKEARKSYNDDLYIN